MLISTDDGRTWHAVDSVRVAYDVDADLGQGEIAVALHLNITTEGVIADVIDEKRHQVLETRSETAQEITDRLLATTPDEGWLPNVPDHQPEIDKPILAIMRWGAVKKGVSTFVPGGLGDCWYLEGEHFRLEDVAHWMYVPEKPTTL